MLDRVSTAKNRASLFVLTPHWTHRVGVETRSTKAKGDRERNLNRAGGLTGAALTVLFGQYIQDFHKVPNMKIKELKTVPIYLVLFRRSKC